VLDGEIVSRDDDALKKQPYESLSLSEVESVDAVAERSCKDGDVLSDARDASGVHLLRRKIFATHPRSGHCSVEALTSSLELLDTHCASLVGI
jgi:hypothetical protein